MPRAIPKWAMLAPIFIPLFLRLGIAPQTVLAAYRVGDSPMNIITPIMAYFPFIVVFAAVRQELGHRHRDLPDAALLPHHDHSVDHLLRDLVRARDPHGTGGAGLRERG